MDIIKNRYQRLISYGIVLFGILVFFIILFIKPSRIILEEAYNYDQKPEVKNITFPFSQIIKTPNNSPSFIELRFGHDSINKHQYAITATYESILFFNHVYKDEVSNIVRIPIDNSIIAPVPNNNIIISIDCINTCENTKMELYNIEGAQTIKTFYGLRKVDYGLLWYGLFPIAIGFTLLPLTKKGSKKCIKE